MIQKTILPLISILFIYLANCMPQIDKGQKISKTYFGVLNFSKTEQKKLPYFALIKGLRWCKKQKQRQFITSNLSLPY